MSMILPAVRMASLPLLLVACDQTANVTSTTGSAPIVALASEIGSSSRKPVIVRSDDAHAGVSRNNALAREHATIVAELRRLLVGTDATLDGAAITDVAQIDACRTRFVTGKGATNIEWAKGGNIAPRDEAGRELNDLPGSDGAHILSVRTGEDGDGISGAVGLLVGECGGGE